MQQNVDTPKNIQIINMACGSNGWMMDVAGSYIHNMNSPVCFFSLSIPSKDRIEVSLF
jgi:hypothetical protein